MTVDWTNFQVVTTMSLDESGRQIGVTLEAGGVSALECVVYVWLDGSGNVIRVGSSKQPIGRRLMPTRSTSTRACRGFEAPPPKGKTAAWLKLAKEGDLQGVVHQPPLIETVAGPVRPYLDIERTMIAALRPPLNRSHH